MITKTLQKLGITCNYVGYRPIILALELALEDENRLCAVTRQIYWVVAEMIPCARCNVERNLRTIIFHAWKTNGELLKEMAGFPMFSPPSVSQFLAILVTYLQRTEK